MNINFCDKNFVIATLFSDYLRAVAPVRTIHIVAPPTILTRGIGACKKKTNRNNTEPLEFWSCIRGFQCAWTPFIGETRMGDF